MASSHSPVLGTPQVHSSPGSHSSAPGAESADWIGLLGTDELVTHLENLHDGPLAFGEIVQRGESAISALERILRGPADLVCQPRTLAADALAAIATPAAVVALIRALVDSARRELSPQLLEAESILVNHIAEHLSRFPRPEVTDALLAALQRRRYPYCAAAAGLTGDARAIPLLIECLYDDAARPAGVAALRRFGTAALKPLIAALLEPLVSGTLEAPSRVDGRVACAKLLGYLATNGAGEARVAKRALVRALSDAQRAVRVRAALELVRCGAPEGLEVVGILVMALDEENWMRAEEVIAALVRIGPAAEPMIVAMLDTHPRHESDTKRRLRATEVAGRLPALSAVGRLRAFHHAPEANLRLAAVTALARMPGVDPGSITLFLNDREPTVRFRALQALRQREALDPAIPAQLLADGNDEVRRLAFACVLENMPAAVPALKHAAWHGGAPAHGLVPRLRLWWHACTLIAGARRVSAVNRACSALDGHQNRI
jgi:hypothetical protein